MSWPTDWDRGSVLGAIEEASGAALSADDAIADTLIAAAQQLGLKPVDLKLWIYDSPEHGWTPANLEKWARMAHLTAPLAACELCGTRLYTPAEMAAHNSQPPACEREPVRLPNVKCGHCGEPVDDPGNHECDGRKA